MNRERLRFSDVQRTALSLDYRIVRGRIDPFRNRVWPFARLPVKTGSVCYFTSLEDVQRNLDQVQQVRQWQAELLPILSEP